jgi:hypothetical protein
VSRPLWSLAIAAIAMAALIGCGGGGGGPTTASSDEEAAITDVLDRYADALENGDSKALCEELISPQDPQVADPKGCEKNYDALTEKLGPELAEGLRGSAIDHIDIVADGTIAQVYRDPDSDKFQRLTLIDGTWYLAPSAPE